MEQGNQHEQPNHAARRRNVTETILWLLIIISLVVIVLQGIGYVALFTLQGKWAVIGLTIVGAGLAAAALNGYLQNSRLKEALKRLTEQQKKRHFTVTLSNGEATENEMSEQEQVDPNWTKKVKFTAVIEERQRLARELHDAVSQQLFAISMTATAVSRTIDRDWERAKRQVQLIEEMAAVAQSEMRALLLHLRPVHLDGKNLGQALTVLVEELKQKVPMTITLEVDDTIVLQPNAEDHLFRIAQEALSNTLRHSKADSMDIRLVRAGDQVYMSLQDSGIGFDLEAKKQTSYGLLTMEERVNELGGSLKMLSKIGEGTFIQIWVPMDV
ncbi:NarL family two-component system sensor histidine kinase LiaS [Paenibacillus castaneae]|uniref:sensor histidine kinase n=1 Tax=Paenibacillus castaneae TaxID=474957 RepID=UPI000C9D1649|nr:sensor histidine kinase [Paenibacillus castaneae]NIK76359.1 NarL family two-component system sensor histidine kinase LiaS [Paenibacillus castaneae]